MVAEPQSEAPDSGWTEVPDTRALLEQFKSWGQSLRDAPRRAEAEEEADDEPRQVMIGFVGNYPLFTGAALVGEESEVRRIPFQHEAPRPRQINSIDRGMCPDGRLEWEVVVEGEADAVTISHTELIQQRRDLFFDFAVPLVAQKENIAELK
jgi:hypothetical protein